MRLALLLVIVVVSAVFVDARSIKKPWRAVRPGSTDVVGFIQGLTNGLVGSKPNIDKCIPDFEKVISEAQTAVDTLNSGLQTVNIGQVGNGKLVWL